MLSTAQLRIAFSHSLGDTSKMVRVQFHGWSSGLLVERTMEDAWRLFSKVMEKHDYKFRESAGGTYNYRPIAGSSRWSLHAYGIALDLNPSKNPYSSQLITDMPKAFRDDIKRIKTKNGKQAFSWGGDWSSSKDAMHWQAAQAPADYRTGVTHPTVSLGGSTPPPKPPSKPSGSWPNSIKSKFKTVSESNAKDGARPVRIVQALLAAHGYVASNTFNRHLQPDGDWGNGTTSAVKQFQRTKGLTADGIVGKNTWNRLVEGLPTRERGYGPATSVRVIQGLFAAWNRNVSHSKGDGSGADALYDGVFGSGVEADVRNFQRLRKLGVDGIVGPNTYTALFVSVI